MTFVGLKIPRRRFLAWFAASLLAAPASLGIAGGPSRSPHDCRPLDEVWLISTRGIECVRAGEAPELCFCVREGSGRWHRADVEQFIAAVGAGRTRFWMHGYKIDPDEALEVGAIAHRALVAPEEPPLRFVIWSWPAEKTQLRPLVDVRQKACRTMTEAYCLAWLLARLDPKAEVSMAGYSYGVRIVTGGLHLAGGGQLCGLRVHPDGRPAMPDRGYRSVLFSAAMNNQWLTGGGFHGLALTPSEAMLSVYTSTDRVLKWYHVADGNHGAVALGYRGIARRPMREGDEGKYAQMDVSDLIGGEHDWQRYLGNGTIAAAARGALAHPPASAPADLIEIP